ncbi:MAG: hypothetical protein HUU46_11780 [Candidatus Hydrogenedentes bacterium]|nr:hypothetical protein [Candidatus Hydrogenedentota bacterium]
MNTDDTIQRADSRSKLSYVDRKYLEALDQRPPYFALLQVQDMIDSVKAMYALQLRQESPSLSGKALRIAVARRFYAADPAALRMLDRIEAADGRQ